jgi:hypothetical protein
MKFVHRGLFVANNFKGYKSRDAQSRVLKNVVCSMDLENSRVFVGNQKTIKTSAHVRLEPG